MSDVIPDGLATGPDGRLRCSWGLGAPEYIGYHDTEWGFLVSDDRTLFEKICLEGFQCGLSWLTILRKRDNFRAAFDNFDHTVVARYGEAEVQRLLADAGIVRHRGEDRGDDRQRPRHARGGRTRGLAGRARLGGSAPTPHPGPIR